MKLKRLFKGIDEIQIRGSKDLEVTGICSNSKRVAPGNLFIAKKGKVDDGARYISEALSAGAIAILTDLYDPSLKNITQVIHPEVAQIEGLIAAQYYQMPSDELFMVGITGTNGKTTTSFLVKYLLDHLEGRSGLIGTIECILGGSRYKSTLTTPDVVSNHRMLREMCLQECTSAVMEVTSHALDQGRVDQIHYDMAVFTNLTLDHLDYHGTLENYARAKNQLFRHLGKDLSGKKRPIAPCAIINADSVWSTQILEGCETDVFTYGLENLADLMAENVVLDSSGTSFDLIFHNQRYACSIPLVGRFNVYNVLAATSVLLKKGHAVAKILALYENLPAVQGRLELVKNALNHKIYVDFAHTNDALINVLECLNEFKTGRILTVFGCGGDRDQSKRPKMAEAAEQFSDLCIVTSDNPRSEDPLAICQEIVKGFKSPDNHLVVLNRMQAIEKAIEMMRPNDLLLVAGKGHETYQIFSHKTVEFDDRKVIQEICLKRSQECVLSSA